MTMAKKLHLVVAGLIFKREYYEEEKKCLMRYDLLNRIIKYIEEVEEDLSYELGPWKPLEKLIEDKQMPNLYYDLLKLKNKK
jgi:hypothetical protein